MSADLCLGQVATDTRLWLFRALEETRRALADLIKAAVARAETEVDVLMPGFTHLQPAQTVRWGHWLLSHAAAWQRDDMRLNDLLPRVATLPLGSGQWLGQNISFPIRTSPRIHSRSRLFRNGHLLVGYGSPGLMQIST